MHTRLTSRILCIVINLSRALFFLTLSVISYASRLLLLVQLSLILQFPNLIENMIQYLLSPFSFPAFSFKFNHSGHQIMFLIFSSHHMAKRLPGTSKLY